MRQRQRLVQRDTHREKKGVRAREGERQKTRKGRTEAETDSDRDKLVFHSWSKGMLLKTNGKERK